VQPLNDALVTVAVVPLAGTSTLKSDDVQFEPAPPPSPDVNPRFVEVRVWVPTPSKVAAEAREGMANAAIAIAETKSSRLFLDNLIM
jgi:hypothetical protein